ncbi:MAG: lysozyme inhibitor LprI family protein [Caulobacteraceae bacterium]
MKLPTVLKSAALALLISAGASAANAASFDCNRARLPDEKAICADRALNDQDVRLSLLYGIVLRIVGMGERDSLRDSQTYWLRMRHACGANRACIARAYATRIADYDRIMQRMYANAPF